MKHIFSFIEKKLELVSHPEKKFSAATNTSFKVAGTGTELIRFEEKKGIYIWVQPEQILFVKSDDHYVKSLIQHGPQKKWMSRHCTIKELLGTLSHGDFIRLNKFYLLNRNRFTHINENEKTLYVDNDFSIPVPHRISRYVLDLLKR
jgi:DNA-binding LytR/AlgR family response regulator